MANLDDFKQIVDKNLEDMDISLEGKKTLREKAAKPRKLWNSKTFKIAAIPAAALVVAVAVTASNLLHPMQVSANENLMESITRNEMDSLEADSDFTAGAAGFSVKLLQQSLDGDKNVLVSPFSASLALGMTANGAKGSTLSQFESVLGGGIPIKKLNQYYLNLAGRLQKDSDMISIADSIWYSNRKDLTVKKDFLQKNADYYGSDAYQLDFSDPETVKKINNWVSTNTGGLLDQVVEKIEPDTVMYLINTLLFEAEWAKTYEDTQMEDGTFASPDGDVSVTYMNSSEGYYLEDGSATGFVKRYQNGNYSFAALLPNEGVSVEDYIAGLTGESFLSLLENAQNGVVYAKLPQFKYEYAIGLNDALQNMGLTDAFDPSAADFSDMGTVDGENLYIGSVLQKTYIEVTPVGTKAGAATTVTMNATSAMLPPEDPKTVELTRPFVYAIIDNQTGLPLFIGCVNNPSAD